MAASGARSGSTGQWNEGGHLVQSGPRAGITGPDDHNGEARRAGGVLTIDLNAIVENWRQLRDLSAPAECAAVVKADAYGLGAAIVAPALAAAGAKTFFVAQLTEALALRPLVPDARVAVLNGLLPGCEADYLDADIVPVLNDLGEIHRWRAAARRVGRPLPAFVHIDTGMSRLGLDRPGLDSLAADPTRLDGIANQGWMTHLAYADNRDHPMTPAQRDRFDAATARLPTAPRSLANSPGIFWGAQYTYDLTRPGCALYGVNPTPGAHNPMRNVIRLAGRIRQVRHVDAGDTVGYGAAHQMARPGKIATIAIGYADGYVRALSGSGHVVIGGHRAAVVGRVSMDLITADVSDIPEAVLEREDLAEVLGPDYPVDAAAANAGTIGYEILTALGDRYARRYVGGPTPEARL